MKNFFKFLEMYNHFVFYWWTFTVANLLLDRCQEFRISRLRIGYAVALWHFAIFVWCFAVGKGLEPNLFWFLKCHSLIWLWKSSRLFSIQRFRKTKHNNRTAILCVEENCQSHNVNLSIQLIVFSSDECGSSGVCLVVSFQSNKFIFVDTVFL